MAFEIVVYERENGSIPFMEFLGSLSPKMKAKILRARATSPRPRALEIALAPPIPNRFASA